MGFPKADEFPLYAANEEWTQAWNKLTSGWLKEKLNRERRMTAHLAYVRSNVPELSRMLTTGYVVDLGPGAGELLEIARWLGHKGIGIDDVDGEHGGMGSEYLQACALMHKRQRLKVHYTGLVPFLEAGKTRQKLVETIDTTCVLLNSRGSLEQMLSVHMVGPPHNEHHDCSKLAWKLDAANITAFHQLCNLAQTILAPGGIFLVHCNGAKNTNDANIALKEAAVAEGLQLVSSNGCLHKWRQL